MLNNRIGALLRMLLRWKGHTWYRDYSKHIRRSADLTVNPPVDIIVLLVDHYEPAKKDGPKAVDTVRDWCDNYRQVASGFADSDGVCPQHSWFYRYDFPDFDILNVLSGYVYEGLGEIEFHLHHGFDTSETFYKRIEEGVQWFNSAGAMISAEITPQKKFAYIAGNWALDNGRDDPQFSGVNDEIVTLSKHGCYADFTFPAIGCTAQPEKVNSIYYAEDDPLKPKSYNTGTDVVVGGSESGNLMIVEGPIFLDWKKSYLESGAIEFFQPYLKDRLRYWEKAHVHVKGRPEWIFFKLHTHGMQSKSIYNGGNFKQLCQDLDEAFTQNENYRLHYVTSREAYNIIKAAEDGLAGNPGDYRDYKIKQPANKKLLVNKAYTLITYSDDKIIIKIDQPGDETKISVKLDKILEIKGDGISLVTVNRDSGKLKSVAMDGNNCSYKEVSPR